MADEIVLKTFAASTIAPVDDAVIQEVYTGDGGIISGATVTIKDANTLHITGGYGAICGREFQIFASDIPVVLSSSGNLNGRLYIHSDRSPFLSTVYHIFLRLSRHLPKKIRNFPFLFCRIVI